MVTIGTRDRYMKGPRRRRQAWEAAQLGVFLRFGRDEFNRYYLRGSKCRITIEFSGREAQTNVRYSNVEEWKTWAHTQFYLPR